MTIVQDKKGYDSMMKKTAISLMTALLLGSVSAMAMDSETLLSQPERYRIIYANQNEIAYADMHTLSGQATMDYPGSLENVNFTMYVETFKENPNAFDFARNTTISNIREFQVAIHANKMEGTYSMNNTLSAMYDVKGKKLDPYSSIADTVKNRKLLSDAKTLFLNLDHQNKAGKVYEKTAKPVQS